MFKKLLIVLASLALMVGLSFSVTAVSSVDHTPESAKKSLVALGDSITSGYGLLGLLPNPNNPNLLNERLVSKDAYPALVADAMGYRVNNLAVSGWTSFDLLNAVTNSNRYRSAIANADLIILNIGGNDVLGYLVEVDFSVYNPYELLNEIGARLRIYYDNLGMILHEIRELNPEAPILHYGFYNPLYEGHSISEALNENYYELYNLLNMLIPMINYTVYNGVMTDEYGQPIESSISGYLSYAAHFDYLYYVDVFLAYETYALFGQKANLFVDEVHPSKLGHQILRDITFEILNN